MHLVFINFKKMYYGRDTFISSWNIYHNFWVAGVEVATIITVLNIRDLRLWEVGEYSTLNA